MFGEDGDLFSVAGLDGADEEFLSFESVHVDMFSRGETGRIA